MFEPGVGRAPVARNGASGLEEHPTCSNFLCQRELV